MGGPGRKQLWLDIVNAAFIHGERSEPEMEVGDMQQAISILLRYVPEDKFNALRQELSDTLEWGEEE